MNSLGVPDSGVPAAPALAWNVSGTIAYASSLFRAAKLKPSQRIKIDCLCYHWLTVASRGILRRKTIHEGISMKILLYVIPAPIQIQNL